MENPKESGESVGEEEEEEEYEHHETSFPTRLREFDEKNDLVFHHLLSAKGDMRRHSFGNDGENHNCFGDQYSRHSPICDVVDEDKELYAAIEQIFNKLCIEEEEDSHHHGANKKTHKLASEHLHAILTKTNQEFDKSELDQYIKHNEKGGYMEFNGYQRILVHFLKDPNAIARMKTEHNKLF